MVKFYQLNLNEPWPARSQFDVIFIRNVLIYFDDKMKRSILTRAKQLLVPGGYLFLAAGEQDIAHELGFESAGPRAAGLFKSLSENNLETG